MVTVAASPGQPIASVWEVSGIATTAPLDAVAVLDDQPSTGTPVGAPTTTTAAGDFVIEVADLAGFWTGVDAPFVQDIMLANDGWAHLGTADAPPGTYQAMWTATADTYCATSAAFFVGP